ncbi:hypothetical protein HY631_02450 [Candidatus Uhrbacteria bacterium]|nr:hypothetical protein [Candidatus Uhrbacteria bacterium]
MPSFHFTQRWFAFFLLYFVVWYPVSFAIVSAYQVTGQPVLYIAANIFTPLWTLFMSYLYFRKAENNWTARLATALGWMVLMFTLAILLVRPVYGLGWTSIANWDVVNANWINVVAIVVGALAAVRSEQRSSKIKPTVTVGRDR